MRVILFTAFPLRNDLLFGDVSSKRNIDVYAVEREIRKEEKVLASSCNGDRKIVIPCDLKTVYVCLNGALHTHFGL